MYRFSTWAPIRSGIGANLLDLDVLRKGLASSWCLDVTSWFHASAKVGTTGWYYKKELASPWLSMISAANIPQKDKLIFWFCACQCLYLKNMTTAFY